MDEQKLTDREMLELAAKAAGYGVEWREWVTSRIAEFGTIKYTKQSGFWLDGKQWNPLTDDGDALRLAVKLKLAIRPLEKCVFVESDPETLLGQSQFSELEMYGSDPNAATRRAIVRATAEIGRSMP